MSVSKKDLLKRIEKLEKQTIIDRIVISRILPFNEGGLVIPIPVKEAVERMQAELKQLKEDFKLLMDFLKVTFEYTEAKREVKKKNGKG